ncbi:MAG: hypothetical protein EXR28_13535 [Betaproteobacteria bacterium]|nr:hypothetical protein [Betaproteobacteria bacterium]
MIDVAQPVVKRAHLGGGERHRTLDQFPILVGLEIRLLDERKQQLPGRGIGRRVGVQTEPPKLAFEQGMRV